MKKKNLLAWLSSHMHIYFLLAAVISVIVIDLSIIITLNITHRLTTFFLVFGIAASVLFLIFWIIYRYLNKPNVIARREKVLADKNLVQEARQLTLVIKEAKLSVEQLKKTEKILKIVSMTLVYLFLVIMALVIIVPFYWMIITSLKSNSEIRDQLTFFPQTVQWSNYVVLFKGADIGEFENNSLIISPFNFFTFLKNTLIVGVISTAGTVITTILAAFAFARLNFKGRELLFSIFLATMMIPGEMMVITNYMTVANLGWLNSDVGVYTAMIVPFWVSVYYIYLLRQNFKQIPNELYYAAKVDGKSDWQYLWKVMVPLAAPTLITVFILKLMGAWNSYVWPNLVADAEHLRLITNGLRSYSPSPTGEVHQGLQMAATMIVTTPLLLLFIFFRKYIMRGVGRAGIKG